MERRETGKEGELVQGKGILEVGKKGGREEGRKGEREEGSE